MLKKILSTSFAAAAIAIGSLAATGSAQAGHYGHHHHGHSAGAAALGFLGGAIVGSALSRPRYYEPDCYWTKQRVRNRHSYGWHYKRVRVCE